MSDDRTVVVRAFSWRDLCPWFVIFKSLPVALSVSVMLLATCSVILAPLGWRLSEGMFVSESQLEDDVAFAFAVAHNRSWPGIHDRLGLPSTDNIHDRFGAEAIGSHTFEMESIYSYLARPYYVFFQSPHMTPGKLAYLLVGMLWTLLLAGFFGGMICRIAIVEFAREERVGLRDAFRFMMRRLRSFLLAPLFPLAGVLLVVLFSALLGLLMNSNLGVFFAGLIWPVAILGGLIITVIVVGLMLGWPLMWGAICGEEAGDEFEALHRSYSYVFQRPFRLLMYAAIALVFGSVCAFFVDHLAAGVVYFSDWATSWGMSHNRWLELHDRDTIGKSRVLGAGLQMRNLWSDLVLATAVGFRFAYFWTAAMAIYLLIRRDVDETEFDEIQHEPQQHERSLPTLKMDSSGVTVTTTAPTTPMAAAESTPKPSEHSQPPIPPVVASEPAPADPKPSSSTPAEHPSGDQPAVPDP